MNNLNRRMNNVTLRLLQILVVFIISTGGFFMFFFVADLVQKKQDKNTFVMENLTFKESIEENCIAISCSHIFIFEKEEAKYRFVATDEEKIILNKGTAYDIVYNNKDKKTIKIDYPKSKQENLK